MHLKKVVRSLTGKNVFLFMMSADGLAPIISMNFLKVYLIIHYFMDLLTPQFT